MDTEYTQKESIDLSGEPLSPIRFLIEVPNGTTNPSEVQLRHIAIIRSNFPGLWEIGMAELQRYFDERLDDRGNARDGIKEAAIAIHVPSEEETDEDFFWNLAFVVKQEVPEQFWEVHFNGLRFDMVVLFS